MSTSSQSFEQVRSILSKLDKDIQAARARRLNTGVQARPATPPPTPHRPAASPARQVEASTPPAANEPGRSGFGIARPLRRGDA